MGTFMGYAPSLEEFQTEQGYIDTLQSKVSTLEGLTEAASTDAAGIVELATNVETPAITDQTRAVTPYGLGAALAKLDLISFAGVATAGPCTATGLNVGDVVFGLVGLTDMGDASASFEAVITVDDQIQQSSESDLSTKNFLALVYRMS